MKRIAIIGGGMSGLLASYVFQQYKRVQVDVFEPGKPAVAFLAGGLKYLARTDEIMDMLDDFGMPSTPYSVNGGILLHGAVEPYPKCFSGMDQERAKRIQRDHYRKTRRVEADDFSVKAMNDPEANPASRRAVSADLSTLIGHLVSLANIRQEKVSNIFTRSTISDRAVVLRLGEGASNYAEYDHCVVTLPIWIAKQICDFGDQLPETHAKKLNLVSVEPLRDPYAKWDYVYTPYTPEDLIHRISPRDLGYSCELNGAWDESTDERLASELNFLFPEGWSITGVKKDLNGHLLPPSEKPRWPDNVKPLGRFAKWDPRATTDVTMKDAMALAEEWFLV